MAVNLIWSISNGGVSIVDTDHGSVGNGVTTTAKTIYLRHNGVNSITSAKLYAKPFTGTYSGAANAATDFAELIVWGDEERALTFGGLLFNMNAAASFPDATWPTYSNKSPSYGAVVSTGAGSSSTNAITLSSATGCTVDGTVPVGSSPNVRFQCKVKVPINEDTVGKRQFEIGLLYSYTS